jgi:hypothetical protein
MSEFTNNTNENKNSKLSSVGGSASGGKIQKSKVQVKSQNLI